jgi:hypothetical protein
MSKKEIVLVSLLLGRLPPMPATDLQASCAFKPNWKYYSKRDLDRFVRHMGLQDLDDISDSV